jgi:3-hydroxyisobutyrate dehydrogenase
MSTVAVLGTGIMGFPIARNLARAGHDVRAWNRTLQRAQPLADDGATVASSPAEAADGADVVITMLAAADAVQDAIADVRDVPVWAQMSTVGLDDVERLTGLAAERNLGYVDAPVLGTKQPAEQAQLVVLAAGAPELRDTADPVFDAIGRKTAWVGDEPGTATRLKLVLNHWVLGLTETLAETIAFAEAIGVDPREFLAGIEGGAMDTPYAHMKGNAILDDALEAAFPLRLAHKDVGLILDAAREAGFEAKLAQVVEQQMGAAVQQGHGDADMAATVHASRSSSARA